MNNVSDLYDDGLLNDNITPSDPIVDYPSLEYIEGDIQVLLIYMYSLTALLSLITNTIVIVVLIFGKRSSRGIRHFLINLAVSDIFMATFCIPFSYTTYVFRRWIFDVEFCPVVQVMQHVSVIVSIYTLTGIGLDRFFAIMHPLKTRWTKSRWVLVLVLIWIMAFATSSVLFVYGQAKPFWWDKKEYYECQENFPNDVSQGYDIFMFVFTFALPLVILGLTYTSIAWKMWKHTSPGNADIERDQHQFQAKLKVIKMLAVVVIVFFFCWLPNQVYFFLIQFDRQLMIEFSKNHSTLNSAVYFTCHWLAMANSFVNPIIYCFLNENFWDDFKQIIRHCSQFMNVGRNSSLNRKRGLGSFSSATYVLSFRTNSGSCQGAVFMKKLPESNDKSTNYYSSGRCTMSDNQGTV